MDGAKTHTQKMVVGDILLFFGRQTTENKPPSALSLFLFRVAFLLAILPRLPGFPLLAAAATTTTATAALAPPPAAAATAVLLPGAVLAVLPLAALRVAADERGGGQPLGEVDLRADGVGQVADHEHVLDVVVEVVLDLGVGHLGGEGERVHQELAQRVAAVALFVEDFADEARDALEEVRDGLEGLGERLDVGEDGGRASLGGGGRGGGAEGDALGVGEEELVRDLDEEARLGGAVGRHGDGGRDVRLGLDGGARLGRDGQVHGRVREGARLRGGEEVLDEGREAVELVRGRVPPEQGLARGALEGQGQHVLLVLDVDLDLVLVLGVRDRKGAPHLDLAAILAAGADQGADHSCRLCVAGVAADGVVDDGEDGLGGGGRGTVSVLTGAPSGVGVGIYSRQDKMPHCMKGTRRGVGSVLGMEGVGMAYLGLDVHGKRGIAGSETQKGGRQGPGQVDEVFLLDSHVGCNVLAGKKKKSVGEPVRVRVGCW